VTHLAAVERQQVTTGEHHPTRDRGVPTAGQAERGQRGNALARTRLADDPERLASRDGVAGAVDGLDHAVIGRELDPQILDVQERRLGHWTLTRGST
jgi:hypothetical protein